MFHLQFHTILYRADYITEVKLCMIAKERNIIVGKLRSCRLGEIAANQLGYTVMPSNVTFIFMYA